MARALIKEIKDAKKNYIINGNFNFWQRTNVTQTYGAQITYHADRFAWAAGTITGAVLSARANPNVYSNTSIIPRSCVYAQQYICSTAQASLGANATAGPWYKMEGYDFNEALEQGGLLNGITLSFYVASSTTGTYTIEFTNSGTNNRYFKTYTITSAGTWQRISMYLTGAELATGIGSGTWDYANGVGLLVRFWLAAGTTSQGVAQNLWTGSTANVPATQPNIFSALNNTWSITGLAMTIGNVVPDFKIRGDSPDDEYSLCRRYYEKSYAVNTNPGAVAGSPFSWKNVNANITGGLYAQKDIPFTVPKRAIPTVRLYSETTGTIDKLRDLTAGADVTTASNNGFETGCIAFTSVAPTAGNLFSAHFTADAEL